MNSTPLSPASIIRLTAFPPAPPTPITLIDAVIESLSSSISSNIPNLPGFAPVLDQLLDPTSESHRDPTDDSPFRRPWPGVVLQCVHRQADSGREPGIGNRFRQSTETDRDSTAGGQVEDLLRQLGHPRQRG